MITGNSGNKYEAKLFPNDLNGFQKDSRNELKKKLNVEGNEFHHGKNITYTKSQFNTHLSK